MSATHSLGIDLGGTNIKGAVCDRGHNIVCQQSIPTEAERGCDHVIARMIELVGELRAAAKLPDDALLGVGVGCPGPLSHSEGLIYHSPNLPGWENVRLRDRMTAALELPVNVENDANAAAFGEFTAGSGSDADSLIMLTLGTGIGGGVVLDRKLWRGAYDNAGELGHMIVVPGGRPCPCGQVGCLERYSSANAVGQRLVEAVEAGEASTLADAARAGQTVTSEDVLEAADAGDALAQRIWDETCYYLALACVNIQHAFNPQVVVLAGGLINAGDALLEPTRRHFDKLAWQIAQDHPKIVFASLGANAGVIGAAALAAP